MTELSRAQLIEKRKNRDAPKPKVEKAEKAETVAKAEPQAETTSTVAKKTVPENKNVKRATKEVEG